MGDERKIYFACNGDLHRALTIRAAEETIKAGRRVSLVRVLTWAAKMYLSTPVGTRPDRWGEEEGEE